MNKSEQNIPQGYKQTVVGVIPKDWEVKEMRNISKINQGLQIPIANRYTKPVEDSYFYITNEFLKPDSKNEYYIKNPHPNVLCDYDDILMTRTGNTGQVVTNVKGAFHNNFFKIKYDKNIVNRIYLYNFLNSRKTQHYLLVLAGNSTIPDLNHKEFYNLKLPVPPLPEQEKIADCLTTWDKSIEKLTALIKAKKQAKKGLMQQLLTGKKRLPGFTDEWKEVKLGEIFKEVKRPIEWDDNQLYDLISVRRRSGGIFHRESLFGHQIRTKNLYNVKINDFLISKMQVLHGATAVVTSEFKDMKVSGSYIILNPKKENKIDMIFFKYFSSLPLFYHISYISSYGVHIEKMTFNLKIFLKEKIKIPQIEEQEAIAEILQTADKEIDLLEEKLKATEQQKKGLMQILLTGKKRLI